MRSCEIGSLGVAALCSSQSSLTELDMSYCTRITDTALDSICSGLPHLQKLSLQGCRAITDMGIAFMSRLSCLEDVNLQGLERITSSGNDQLITFSYILNIELNLLQKTFQVYTKGCYPKEIRR